MITNVVNLNKERHWCSYHLKKCFKYSFLFQRLQDEKDRKAAVVLAEEVVSERGGFDSLSNRQHCNYNRFCEASYNEQSFNVELASMKLTIIGDNYKLHFVEHFTHVLVIHKHSVWIRTKLKYNVY